MADASWNQASTRSWGREYMIVAFLSVAITLVLHGRFLNSFLYIDDFCAPQCYRRSPREYVQAILLLKSEFRPVGIVLYNWVEHLFGLRSVYWHITTLLLHIVIGLMVYWLGLLLTRSRFVALTACLTHACQQASFEVLWHFGAVFDVLAALFYWSTFACYLQARRRGGRWHLAAVPAFLLALGSKEMAVTLPVILTLYELLWDPPWRSPGQWRAWGQHLLAAQWPYYLIAGVFFVQHFVLEYPIPRVGVNLYDFSLHNWFFRMNFYLGAWFADRVSSSMVWGIGLLTLLVGVFWRDRVLIFGCIGAIVALAPVTFLPESHMTQIYWYLPQGFVALATGEVWQRLRMMLTRVVGNRHQDDKRFHRLLTVACLTVLVGVTSLIIGDRKRHVENWWLSLSTEYRSFIEQMLSLYPTLPRHTCVILDGSPPAVDSSNLFCFLRVIYKDETLQGFVVTDPRRFNFADHPGTALFLRYQDGHLVLNHPGAVVAYGNASGHDRSVENGARSNPSRRRGPI